MSLSDLSAPRRRRVVATACAAVFALAIAGCGTATHASTTATRAADTTSQTTPASSTAGTSSATQPITRSLTTDGISRMTLPTSLDAGRFPDPYLIDVSRTPGGAPLTIYSGTLDELMACTGTITPGCFSPSPISVTDGSALSAELRADGESIYHEGGHNIFRMPDGDWEMSLTAKVRRGSTTWSLCLNAHPASGPKLDGVPTHWVADSIIVGSPRTPEDANYDARYLILDGQLSLLYVKHFSNIPERDGIVAQRMTSPTQPASSPPSTLLAPSGLSSERAIATNPSSDLELLEAFNVIRIGSVWVLTYTTGTVTRTDYKIGVAYADSPVPRGGYRKVLIPDPKQVWGDSGYEVDYLLQSEEPDWPHDSRAAVQAPGVGAIVHRGASWYLSCAGYPPFTRPVQSASHPALGPQFDPDLRVPYLVKLHVAVPTSANAVSRATGGQMAGWIRPELGP